MNIDEEKKKVIIASLLNVFKDDNLTAICKHAYKNMFRYFKTSKKRVGIVFCISAGIAVLLTCTVLNSQMLLSFFNLNNVILLAFLAMIVTGYAIFQAMSSTESLISCLMETGKESKLSFFLECQYNFFCQTVTYIVLIVFDYLMIFLITVFTQEVDCLCNEFPIATGILIGSFIFLLLLSFIEMISFIYNLYQIFTISSMAKVIKEIKEALPKTD